MILGVSRSLFIRGQVWGLAVLIVTQLLESGFAWPQHRLIAWLGLIVLWSVAGYVWARAMDWWGRRQSAKSRDEEQ